MPTREWVIKNKKHLQDYHKKWQIKNKKHMKKYRKNVYQNNKVAIKKHVKNWYSGHPDKVKNAKLKRDFGISVEEYDAMVLCRNDRCDICHQPESRRYKGFGKIIALAVDHDHKTGKIRGLLCSRCNLTIGRVRDDIQILKNAIKYLEDNNAVD